MVRIIVILSLICLSNAAFADSKGLQTTKKQERICDRLLGYSRLHRKSLDTKHNSNEYKKIQYQLKDFLVPSRDEIEKENEVVFLGLDIDGDGKEDRVMRACGSGVGMLCTLYVELSQGGKFDTGDRSLMYLAKLDGQIYSIEEVNGRISPYGNRDSTQILSINKAGAQRICN